MIQKKPTIKFILVFFISFSAIFDLFITLQHINFIGFESNPLYILTESIFLLILAKFLVNLAIIYFFLKADKTTRFKQYFWVYFILLLTIAQFFAGISNISTKEQVKDIIEINTGKTYEDMNDLPTEEIKAIQPENKEKLRSNLILSSLFLYVPLFISLSSFKLWELLYCE